MCLRSSDFPKVLLEGEGMRAWFIFLPLKVMGSSMKIQKIQESLQV